jgi:hypothetical protein
LSLLGIRPAPGGIEVARPLLPEGVSWLTGRNLVCRDTRVDLVFRRWEGRISVEILKVSGSGRVTLSSEAAGGLPER